MDLVLRPARLRHCAELGGSEGFAVVGDGAHLTVSEAAKLLDVSPGTVRNYIAAGRLKGHRLPSGHRRVDAADAERLRREIYGDATREPEDRHSAQ